MPKYFFHLALLSRPGLVLVVGMLVDVVGEVEEDDVGEPTKHQLLHLVRNLQQLFVHLCFFLFYFGHHTQTFTTSTVVIGYV